MAKITMLGSVAAEGKVFTGGSVYEIGSDMNENTAADLIIQGFAKEGTQKSEVTPDQLPIRTTGTTTTLEETKESPKVGPQETKESPKK